MKIRVTSEFRRMLHFPNLTGKTMPENTGCGDFAGLVKARGVFLRVFRRENGHLSDHFATFRQIRERPVIWTFSVFSVTNSVEQRAKQ